MPGNYGDVETWRYGALEVHCRHAAVEVWRFRGLESGYRCSDGGREIGRLDVGVATWRYGGWEARVGVAPRKHRGMEPRRHAEGVAKWRHEGMEAFSSRGALRTWGRGGMEV